MLSNMLTWLEDKERAWRESFGNDISTPAKRREAWRHFNWVDHAFLRVWWTNFYPVAPGVFRSNQPSPERIKTYAARGLKAVLNLRGDSLYSHYLFEKEATDAEGLELRNIHLSATELPSRATIAELEDHFRTLPRPFVMHCKSGADRAGFASALYLLLIEDRPIEEAQQQLSFKYLHFKHSRKGILDYGLERYRAAFDQTGISFRDWLDREYDPIVFAQAFAAGKRRG